jgi:ParB family chromosome partitioning protein
MQKNALGRGLGALISGAAKRGGPGMAEAVPGTEGAVGAVVGMASEAGEGVTVGSAGVNQVAITSIVPSPMQPRKTFRDEQLTELMESIRELELIAGERRFRACQKLGLGEVPVIEREAGDREVLEMALIENLQREDLNPVEEAEAYTRLAKEFGLRQEDIAQRVGKNRATVANAMRLLDLAAPVRGLLAQGLITTGHAKALLGLRDAALQTMVADMVVRNGLTVRQTEQQVQKELAGTGSAPAAVKAGKPKGPDLGAHLHRIQSNLRQHFATQVTLQHTPKKGRIEIEYYGDDDLGRILELLGIEAE